ncbi:hypothetical protein MTO96_018527 [Rhipicephalus appendiculatus]
MVGVAGPGVVPGAFPGVGVAGGASAFPSLPSLGSSVGGLPSVFPGSSSSSPSGSSVSVGASAVPSARPGFSGSFGFSPVGSFYGPGSFGSYGGFYNRPTFYPGYYGFGDYFGNGFGHGAVTTGSQVHSVSSLASIRPDSPPCLVTSAVPVAPPHLLDLSEHRVEAPPRESLAHPLHPLVNKQMSLPFTDIA